MNSPIPTNIGKALTLFIYANISMVKFLLSSGESGHITRQYSGKIGDPCDTNSLTRCVDHGLPNESKALEQVSEWKWQNYNNCSTEQSSQGFHSACGDSGFCCRNTENFCPVGALEPIRDMDSNSAVSCKSVFESL